MTANKTNARLFASDIDWWTVAIYLAMVLFGWINIYAAVFDESHSAILDLGQRSGLQFLWICVSFSLGIAILLIDAKYWHMFSYPLYFVGLALMLLVMMIGQTVNGAQSWIELGPIKIQPVEFMKLFTALALARYMSGYDFSLNKARSLYYIGLIVGIPVLLILMQNDTGSAMVFAAFFIMLYREGFGAAVYVIFFLLVFLFIISFLWEPLPILYMLLLLCLGVQAALNRNFRATVRYFALIVLLSTGVYFAVSLCGGQLSFEISTLVGIVLSLPAMAVYSMRRQLRNLWNVAAVFVLAVAFTHAIDYVFTDIMQPHQQKRILDLLGLEYDPQGVSYNVIQSKIAIGSGGFTGKGFLNGTQTRFNFVPEQSTDFIFCTVGEEWGFVGTGFVVALFGLLIVRLMRMGERQQEPFGRIYCYSVAAIFFVHFVINVGMTIGLFPVVGIPLPFFSYGGSSLLAFTLLLFVAIRLDSSQYDDSDRKLL